MKSSSRQQLRKLPRPARDRVLDAIEDLADDPHPFGSRKLVDGQSAWRIRVGDYRVIYEIDDGELLVTVIRAAHRREVYR